MKVHSLGVLLDLPLSLNAQILVMAKNAFEELKLVYQLHPFLKKSDVVMVLHALITSWLNYCIVLFMRLECLVGPKFSSQITDWVWLEGSNTHTQTHHVKAIPLLLICF